MSDLEDLDTGPEALPEEEVSASADPLTGDSVKRASASVDKSLLVKAAVVLAFVVIGGGAYFVMSKHRAPRSSFPSVAAQRAAASRAALTSRLSSTTGAVVPDRNGTPKSPDLLPAAIPPLEAGATPSGMTAPATPPIVNDMPPSSEQLSRVGAPKPPSAAPFAPVAPTSAPTSIDAQIPGYPAPSAAPSITAPVVPPSSPAMPSPMGTTIPSMPAVPAIPGGAPAPFKSGAAANAMAPAEPAIQPLSPPVVKNEMPMPTAAVAPVSETDINKAQENRNANENNADSAKVEALQNKIADLEKTITQLQEAAVTKEDTAEGKTFAAVSRTHHTAKRTHHRAHAAGHGNRARWVLRAAKPGVAWVAKKDSDDLQMVNVGDTLRGVGTVTAISQDESGQWVIHGSQGRISQ